MASLNAQKLYAHPGFNQTNDWSVLLLDDSLANQIGMSIDELRAAADELVNASAARYKTASRISIIKI